MSVESRRKMSVARKGTTMPPFTPEHCQRISESKKGNQFRLGKHHSSETRQRIRESLKRNPANRAVINKMAEARRGTHLTPEHRKNIGIGGKGRLFGPETRYKMRLARMGSKSAFWRGGISCTPYTPEWNYCLKRHIRKRDNYTCRICGLPQGKRTHDVHHINYNKKSCAYTNLLTLCHKCHIATNFRRGYWMFYLQRMMMEIYQEDPASTYERSLWEQLKAT